MQPSRLLTVFIRALSAISRFGLFLYLGRNVDPETVGIYALISAVAALFVQFVGLEFHYHNSRTILAVDGVRKAQVIRDQFILHLLTYLVVVPWLVILFIAGLLDWHYALYFFPLVVFEHLSQEVFRILVMCFRPVFATIVLFVRTGLWVLIFLPIMEVFPNSPALETLLITWLSFSAASVFLGFLRLRSELSAGNLFSPIDWRWIMEGTKAAFPFFVTTCFLTALQLVDRFVLQYFHGEAAVGVVFFFSSLASFFYTFLIFSVAIFHGPKMIHAYQNLTYAEYRKERAVFIKNHVLVGATIVLPAIVAIYPVLGWVGKTQYADFMHVYWIMLLANVVMVIADFFNLELYVRRLDTAIMWAVIASAIISIVLQISFVSTLGVIGAPIATTCSYVTLGIVRYAFLNRSKKMSYRQ